MIEGRPFDATDDSTAPRRAIINDVAARAMWPGQDRVVGERVRVGADSTLVEVVGVVRRVTQEFPTERPVAQVFMPYAQVPTPRQAIFVRSDAPMDMTLDAVRRVLRGIDPAAAVSDVRSYASFLHEGKAFFLYRVGSALTLALGVLGLLQTLVGLYGVIAYGVSQRAREFGIRLALGARHSQLVRGIVGPQSRYVAAGLTIGLVGAAVLLPAASAVLAVSPRDPWIYTGCAALLGALSAVALYLPARRAARAGPMRALRSDQP